jgi:predicted acylesterase/phospholipase RssA
MRSGLGGPLGLALMIWLRPRREALMTFLAEHGDEPPFDVLLRHWPRFVAYMGRDMGLFDGGVARATFDRLLVDRMPQPGVSTPLRHVTFAEHYRFFGKKLLVTGTNLTTGRTQLFSADETPNFPVADAVRSR